MRFWYLDARAPSAFHLTIRMHISYIPPSFFGLSNGKWIPREILSPFPSPPLFFILLPIYPSSPLLFWENTSLLCKSWLRNRNENSLARDKDGFSERFLRTVERRVPDARLKYADIQDKWGWKWGRVRGIAPAGSIDGLAPATTCRKTEANLYEAQFFFRITNIRVRLTAGRLLPAKAI